MSDDKLVTTEEARRLRKEVRRHSDVRLVLSIKPELDWGAPSGMREPGRLQHRPGSGSTTK